MTAKYNFKRGLVILCLGALTFAFSACEKEKSEPNNPGNPSNPQQRTEEFIYNINLEFYRDGSSAFIPHEAFADTAAKYAADQSVKQIHITPSNQRMCETLNATKMQTRANILDGIYNQSNNKLSGENTTLVLDSAAFHTSTVQNVLHNKLKIALVQR